MASTVARAGVLPGDTQASQTAFISAKFAMSVIQILAERSLVLLVPAVARKSSTKCFWSARRYFYLSDYRQRCRRDRRYRRGSLPCSYAVLFHDVRSSSLTLSSNQLNTFWLSIHAKILPSGCELRNLTTFRSGSRTDTLTASTILHW